MLFPASRPVGVRVPPHDGTATLLRTLFCMHASRPRGAGFVQLVSVSVEDPPGAIWGPLFLLWKTLLQSPTCSPAPQFSGLEFLPRPPPLHCGTGSPSSFTWQKTTWASFLSEMQTDARQRTLNCVARLLSRLFSDGWS